MTKAVIDSNVVIRLIIKDSPIQLFKSQKLISDIAENKAQGFISILVVNEIIWILEKFYELKRKDFIPDLLKLLSIKNIKIIETEKNLIIDVLKKFQIGNFDFTDVYLSKILDKKTLFSFDKDFDKLFNSN